jgi:hypothetical protein
LLKKIYCEQLLLRLCDEQSSRKNKGFTLFLHPPPEQVGTHFLIGVRAELIGVANKFSGLKLGLKI